MSRSGEIAVSVVTDPEPLVYSIKDAAHVLGTSPTTIDRLIEQGALPLVPHMGKRKLIPRAAVVRLVDSGETRPAESVPRVTPAGRTERPEAASA